MKVSMRRERVSGLLAEETAKVFAGGGIEVERHQPGAGVAQPDAQPAIRQGGDRVARFGLDKGVSRGGEARRVERYGRLQPGARGCKLVDDGFEVVRVELAFHLDRHGLSGRLLRRLIHWRNRR